MRPSTVLADEVVTSRPRVTCRRFIVALLPVRYDVDGRLADSLLPQRPQRPAPRDHLIEHVVNRLLMMRCGLEDAEDLEIGEEPERASRAHGIEQQPSPYQTKTVQCPHPTPSPSTPTASCATTTA